MDYFNVISQTDTQAVLQLKPNYTFQTLPNNEYQITTTYVLIENPNSLSNYNFEGSTLTGVSVSGTVQSITSYSDLVTYIYKVINNGPKIIYNTKLAVKTIEIVDPNYIYVPEVGVGYQTDTTTNYLFEVCNQASINLIKLNLNITLNSGTLVTISL